MHPVEPPLALYLQVLLIVQEEIGRGHGATGEEVGRHPPLLKVVRGVPVGKDVNEELATGLEGPRNLGQELLVVFHVLKHLDGHDPVVGYRAKLVVCNVARGDGQVAEPLRCCLAFNVLSLGPGVGKGRNLGVGENFSIVERPRSPSTSAHW